MRGSPGQELAKKRLLRTRCEEITPGPRNRDTWWTLGYRSKVMLTTTIDYMLDRVVQDLQNVLRP